MGEGHSCKSVVEEERSLPFTLNQVISYLRDHLENILDITRLVLNLCLSPYQKQETAAG